VLNLRGGGGGRAGDWQPRPRLMGAFLVISNCSSVGRRVISTKITVAELQYQCGAGIDNFCCAQKGNKIGYWLSALRCGNSNPRHQNVKRWPEEELHNCDGQITVVAENEPLLILILYAQCTISNSTSQNIYSCTEKQNTLSCLYVSALPRRRHLGIPCRRKLHV